MDPELNTNDSLDLSPGEMVDKNQIIEKIADGGMAVVYKTKHVALETFRALKILKPETADEAERFITEARITANLDHPNIIKCHSNGIYNDNPYIELEYIKGKDLQQLIEERGKINAITALCITHVLCEALHYAHNCTYTLYNEQRVGIVHRDIKPANILISDNGVVKLTDFGIVKVKNLSIHTETVSAIIGTEWYMAPEQMRKPNVDSRSDIYSLGCVLYEMLTGEPAFPYDNILDIVLKKEKNDYARSKLKDTPKDVVKILERMIENDLDKRYQSVSDIITDIENYFKKFGGLKPEKVIGEYISNETFKIKRKRPITPITLVVLVFVVGLSSVFFNTLKRLNDIESEKAKIQELKQSLEQNKKDSLSRDFSIKAPKPESFKPVAKTTKIVKKPTPKNRMKKEELKRVDAIDKQRQPGEFLELLERGRYTQCIKELSKIDFMKNDTLYLCYLGSLIETKQIKKAGMYIFTKNVKSNGYQYYLKGMYSLYTDNFKNAEEMFLSSLTKKPLFDNRQKVNYYLTKNSIKQFTKYPNEENKRKLNKRVNSYIERYCKDGKGWGCEELSKFRN